MRKSIYSKGQKHLQALLKDARKKRLLSQQEVADHSAGLNHSSPNTKAASGAWMSSSSSKWRACLALIRCGFFGS